MVHSDLRSSRPLNRFIAIIIVFVFTLHSIAFDAWAAGGSPAAITGFRSGKSQQEDKVRNLLANQLKSNKNLEIEPDALITTKLQDYTSSTVDPRSQAVIGSAYERFNTGMQFYRKLDLSNSLKEFNASVRGYREGISVLRDNHYLLFSHLYLGIILHFLGRVQEGKKFIQEMVMLDAERKTRVLPQRDFPPKIVELHKQITKEVLAKPISTLSVDSTPPGARIMFDGSEVGKTPFQIKDIPSGQHFLALDLQGHQYYGAPIQVNAGAQSFTTVLKEKNIFQAYPPEARTESVKAELKTIAQKLDVDILILGNTVLKDNNNVTVSAQMFDAKSGSFTDVYEETVSLKKPKLVVIPGKLAEGFNGKAAVAATPVAPAKPTTLAKADVKEPANEVNLDDFNEKPKKNSDSSDGAPIYKKWWFWAGVGALVIGGGGAYYLMQDRSADSNIVTIPNPL